MAINYVSHRGILLEIYADLTLALGFGVDVVVVSGPAILTGSGVSGCLWALDPSRRNYFYISGLPGFPWALW